MMRHIVSHTRVCLASKIPAALYSEFYLLLCDLPRVCHVAIKLPSHAAHLVQPAELNYRYSVFHNIRGVV